jgi:hypothetical protein
MYYVYALIDPRDNLIHYVGLTGNVPTRRLADHLSDRSSVKGEWLLSVLDSGFMPSFVVLQHADDLEQAHMRESWWISTGELLGWPLTNIAKMSKNKSSTLERGHPEIEEEVVAVVEEIRASIPELPEPPFDVASAPKRDLIFWWRDRCPTGTQAQFRIWLQQHGTAIARGYISDTFAQWEDTTQDKEQL